MLEVIKTPRTSTVLLCPSRTLLRKFFSFQRKGIIVCLGMYKETNLALGLVLQAASSAHRNVQYFPKIDKHSPELLKEVPDLLQFHNVGPFWNRIFELNKRNDINILVCLQ